MGKIIKFPTREAPLLSREEFQRIQALTPELERELFDMFRTIDELNAKIKKDMNEIESIQQRFKS